MDRHASNAYFQEVLRQARIGLWSLESVRRLSVKKSKIEMRLTSTVSEGEAILSAKQRDEIARLNESLTQVTTRMVLYLQSFVAASGVISAIFWPNPKWGTGAEKKARAKRGRDLRGLAGMPEDAALRYVPGSVDDVRGGLLHLDEMIDDAIALNPGKRVDTLIAMRTTGTTGMLGSGAVRAFDETTLHLYVGNRDTDLTKIAVEMHALLLSMKVTTKVGIIKLRPDAKPGGLVLVSHGTVGGPPINPAERAADTGASREMGVPK